MNLKRRAHFAEETYKQWAMIRALAFAERDWIFCCTIIFLLNKTFRLLRDRRLDNRQALICARHTIFQCPACI